MYGVPSYYMKRDWHKEAKEMADQEPVIVGGPEKNKQVEADAKRAKGALADVKEALDPAVAKARKSLEKLEASAAVSSARSALALLEDTLLGADRDLDRILQQLPKPEKDTSK